MVPHKKAFPTASVPETTTSPVAGPGLPTDTAPESLPARPTRVQHFFQSEVIPRNGADVTMSELHMAYRNFCDEHDWPAVTAQQFDRQATDIMMQVHRVPLRADIQRNKKDERGFLHVALKRAVAR